VVGSPPNEPNAQPEPETQAEQSASVAPEAAPPPHEGSPTPEAATTPGFASFEPALGLEISSAPLAIDIQPEAEPPPPEAPQPSSLPGPSEQLEELADDMLDLIKRISAMEQVQHLTMARLDELAAAQAQGSHQHARQLHAMHQELLSERRALTAQSTLQAILPSLDGLRVMRAGLDPELDDRTIAQLDAISISLASSIQALGFQEITATVGQPYDATWMKITGFSEGAPGVVLEISYPGYRAGDVVARHCGVCISNPAKTEEAPTKEA
jgi:molecular chaperone GrpE (heat shock protein)